MCFSDEFRMFKAYRVSLIIRMDNYFQLSTKKI